MSRVDVVIFGATGFTGKYAVQEMVRLANKHPGLTWAVAGRSEKKLHDILIEASNKTGEDQSQIKKIIADVNDEESLQSMCSQAKVLVNCVGPYWLYGEAVVKAAIHSRAHYVDVSGEPQFIETMQLRYDSQARDAGVLIISACGFDSIPNDMGVRFIEKNFNGVLNAVESFLSSNTPVPTSGALIHYGTWESLIYSLANWKDRNFLRKQLFPEQLTGITPKLERRKILSKYKDGWLLPFPGADASIVYRTQRHLMENDGKRPVQFKPYIKFPSFINTLLIMVTNIFLFMFSQLSFTRSLLFKYPKVFSLGFVSREGPSEEVMNNTKFEFELVGYGWKEGSELVLPYNKKVVAKITGFNPGYGATVSALLWSALTILKERDNIPLTGGVTTTGVAFGNTKLIENLNENYFKFQIVETSSEKK